MKKSLIDLFKESNLKYYEIQEQFEMSDIELLSLVEEYKEYKLLEDDYLKNNNSDSLRQMSEILYRISNSMKIISEKLKNEADIYKMKNESMTFRNIRDTIGILYELSNSKNISFKRLTICLKSAIPEMCYYIDSYVLGDFNCINKYFKDDLYYSDEYMKLIEKMNLENHSFVISSDSALYNKEELPFSNYNCILRGLHGNIYCYLKNDKLGESVIKVLNTSLYQSNLNSNSDEYSKKLQK